MTTEIVEVPDLVNPGIFPTPSGNSAAYNRASRAWADQQQPFANSLVEIAESALTNTLATAELAHVATQKSQEASQSAQSAADDAQRLASLDALWLGSLSADPTTGRNGAALVAGNAYVNTATGYMRAYNGAEWVQGLSAIAGVISLAGQTGILELKTVGGHQLLGSGDIRFSTFEIGDARQTVAAPGSDWLEAEKIYLQSSYPELLAEIGVRPDTATVTKDAALAASSSSQGVAVAEDGTVVSVGFFVPVLQRRSSTGEWDSSYVSSQALKLGAVAYGGGVFIAVSYMQGDAASSSALRSTDKGRTWSLTTLPATSSWCDVAYDPESGYWFAAHNAGFAVSRDGGLSWVAVSLPSGLTQSGGMTIAPCGSGKFLVMVRGVARTDARLCTVTASTVSWSTIQLPASISWFGAAMRNGVLLMAGYQTQKLWLCRTSDLGISIQTEQVDVPAEELVSLEWTDDFIALFSSVGTVLTSMGGGPFVRTTLGWTAGRISSATLGGGAFAVSAGSTNGGLVSVTGYSYDKATQFYVPQPSNVTAPFKNWVKAK